MGKFAANPKSAGAAATTARSGHPPAASRAAPRPRPLAFIAPNHSAEERQARAAAEAFRRTPAGSAPLISDGPSAETKTLSEAGRRYFEPRIGPDLDAARVHVGGRADPLTRLAGAEAATWGRDIYMSSPRFAPDTAEGRALLGHELTHAAQSRADRPQLFRQPDAAAHYPSEDEEQEIEGLLSRDLKETGAAAANVPGKPATDRGRQLSPEDRQALVNRLEPAFFGTITSLDTGAPGADTKSVLDEADAFAEVTRAKAAIDRRFAAYYADRDVTLTQDPAGTPAARRAARRVLVEFHASPDFVDALARTIITTHCKECLAALADLNAASRSAVIEDLRQRGLAQRREQLQRVSDARVPGAYSHPLERVGLVLRPREDFYHTAVHELVHVLAHPAFRAAFGDEDNINEGFTQYFANEVLGSGVDQSYAAAVEKIADIRTVLSGPFHFTGGAPAEESLRQAYFQGHLELIGWRPSGPTELAAVEAAGGSAQWDPDIAKSKTATYQAQALAQQAPSRNVLGVGLYFTPRADDPGTIAVRYARVLYRTAPYAKGQLLAEGELLGSPTPAPKLVGGSIGVRAEYQEPYFYAGAGVRFVGTAAPTGGTDRLDVSPVAGFGVRAWQTVRVGVEGYVLLPVAGEGVQYGAGATVGVEF